MYDGYFKNGKRLLNLVRLNEMEGYWKEYDKNGLLLSISERNIVTGEKEGICYYYKNGEISRVVNCSEGKESEYSGYLKLYDEPRKLWFEGQYYNGIFHGDVQQDASSGDTAFEGFYDNGKILRTEKMKEKRGYRKEYDKQDHLVHICKRDKNGRFVGICYRYDANGRISRISEWKGGKEKALIKMFNGDNMTEYKSGIKRYEGEFCDSFFFDYCRNGQGKEFDKDGKTVIYSGCYLVGKRHGNGISYKNRKINYDGEWIQGKKKTNYYVCLSLRIVIIIIIIIGLTIGIFYLNMVVGIIVGVFLLLWIILNGFWTYDTVNSRFSLQLAKVLHKPNFKIGNDHFNQISKLSFPSHVSLIEIGDNCFKSVQTFKMDGLHHLKSLKIGKNSFTQKKNDWGNDKSKSFHILNCESLESIEIGEYSFSDFGGQFVLRNLPKLLFIRIGNIGYESYNFPGSSFVLEGTDIALNK